ncbi:MAG: hypothetical protein M1820_010228 [Bogoriella megaspora]|nr:MAG: hypothetical protein M1820_010228 [Bogoriella megaspora]
MADATPSCASCKKSGSNVPNLKVCAKCQTTHYCSRECQKVDWKNHKKVCAQNASNNTSPSGSSPMKNLDVQIDKPFTRLDNNTYLHGRSEKDVYKLLIDSFRLREADDYKFEGEVSEDSIYAGAPTSITGFHDFLQLAKTRGNLLPDWWSQYKEEDCENFGDNDQWSNLGHAVEKKDIQEHYGHNQMPMQLRMLAETVYGSGPAGQDGTSMRLMMKSAESGGNMSMMNLGF